MSGRVAVEDKIDYVLEPTAAPRIALTCRVYQHSECGQENDQCKADGKYPAQPLTLAMADPIEQQAG